MDLTVTSNDWMDGNYILMKLTGGTTPLPTMKPGQFAELKIEGSPSTYLRRPISINYVDREHNELWLLIQRQIQERLDPMQNNRGPQKWNGCHHLGKKRHLAPAEQVPCQRIPLSYHLSSHAP